MPGSRHRLLYALCVGSLLAATVASGAPVSETVPRYRLKAGQDLVYVQSV